MGQSVQEWTKYNCERQPLINLKGYKQTISIQIF